MGLQLRVEKDQLLAAAGRHGLYLPPSLDQVALGTPPGSGPFRVGGRFVAGGAVGKVAIAVSGLLCKLGAGQTSFQGRSQASSDWQRAPSYQDHQPNDNTCGVAIKKCWPPFRPVVGPGQSQPGVPPLEAPSQPQVQRVSPWPDTQRATKLPIVSRHSWGLSGGQALLLP